MLYFTFGELFQQINLLATNVLLQILVWLIVLDIFTGFIKSFKVKTSNSTTGLFGVLKHTLVILLTMIVNVYLPLFGYENIANAIVLYLMLCYLISLLENWVLIGLPAPQFLIDKLEKLKDTVDSGKKVTIESAKDIIIEVKPEEDIK